MGTTRSTVPIAAPARELNQRSTCAYSRLVSHRRRTHEVRPGVDQALHLRQRHTPDDRPRHEPGGADPERDARPRDSAARAENPGRAFRCDWISKRRPLSGPDSGLVAPTSPRRACGSRIERNRLTESLRQRRPVQRDREHRGSAPLPGRADGLLQPLDGGHVAASGTSGAGGKRRAPPRRKRLCSQLPSFVDPACEPVVGAEYSPPPRRGARAPR
jgi:hypothetical protein